MYGTVINDTRPSLTNREMVVQLSAENAKLREFAAEAWELLTCNEPNFVWSGLRKKARELGIEVKP